jgi:ABC-type branched-subunit amino acid transport system substrate-binding protein
MVITIVLGTLLFACPLIHAQGFQTIAEIQTYAQTHPEFPAADDANWLDPDYSSFHRSLQPTFIRSILESIYILSPLSWTSANFEHLLEQVVQQRTRAHISNNTAVKLSCSQPCKIFIWGNIYGAFHSLSRALQWLHTQKIIDQNLKIIQPDHYLVFNGNAINRSPYIIETLMIILRLLLQNPEHVFYIKGNHEDNNYWQNFGLNREIRTRLTNQEKNRTLLTQFFNTLPLVLYITREKDKPQDFIRISHKNRDQVPDDLYSQCLSQPEKKSLVYCSQNSVKEVSIKIHAIFKSEPALKEQQAHQGLGALEQDYGATAWSVFSSPTKINMVNYDFYYDAFVELVIAKPITNSSITLINRDTRSKKPFERGNSFNVVTGLPTMLATGLSEITFGSTLSLIQGVPAMGQRVKSGIFAKINQINQSGGINGKHISIIIYNDDYVPYLARYNVTELMKENIKTILLPTGSPTLESYLDYIRENKVLVLFPITGAPQFRKPDLKGLIHMRATYGDEVNALIHYLITEYGARKFAFFYQDDAYGIGPVETAHETLKKLGITTWVDLPYARATVNFKEHVEKLMEHTPDAIGLFSTAFATQELFRQIGVENLSNRHLFGISFLGEESFRRYIKKIGIKVLFGAVVPNPKVSSLDIVKEYRATMNQLKSSYDIFSLEAYIATSLLVDIMKKIENNITKDNIQKELEALNNYSFKGLTLTFNAQTRSLARSVWIETGPDTEWIKKDIP